VHDDGRIGSAAHARPQLAVRIALANEKRERRLGRLRAQHQYGLGLGVAREVVEIGIDHVAKLAVASHVQLRRRRDHQRGVIAEQFEHARASRGVAVDPIHPAPFEGSDSVTRTVQ
jgi:hypothetical protein